MTDINESDWKLFKKLRDLALERHSQQANDKIRNLLADTSKTEQDLQP